MNTPAKRWKHKGLQLTAWENKGRVSFQITKSYLDKEKNEWKDTRTIFRDDLVALKDMIEEATHWSLTGNIPEMAESLMPQSKPIPVPKITTGKPSEAKVIQDDDDIPF
jgi:hypothetical protein